MRTFQRVGYLAVAGAIALSTAASAHDDRLSRIAAFFAPADILSGPEIVDCTLSGGTRTRCFRITVTPTPQDYTPGPWCPTHVGDGADAGGIWFADGGMVDVDGAFIRSLAERYGDSNWQLYDPETGDVRFTGTLEACQAAARPDVDPAYRNTCVQCLPEYMPEDAVSTYTIPLEPVPVSRPPRRLRGPAGLARNGVRLDGPAPVEAILGAYTIAPLDDCGGHVNLHAGYHYHAVTDCLTGAPNGSDPARGTAEAGHGTEIGIAMDGYAIFPHLTGDGRAPEGLDACNGHDADGIGYHYHAGAAGANAILGCHVAETGCASEDSTATCDATRRPPRP
ncbi:YHYH protein [Paralimibaculum aggregatum]|nr:YHYH protein [Limibaculum sp. NKW23]